MTDVLSGVALSAFCRGRISMLLGWQAEAWPETTQALAKNYVSDVEALAGEVERLSGELEKAREDAITDLLANAPVAFQIPQETIEARRQEKEEPPPEEPKKKGKKGRPPKAPREDGLKECGECGETKPRGEFHKNATAHDGLMSACKECRGKKNAKRWADKSRAEEEQAQWPEEEEGPQPEEPEQEQEAQVEPPAGDSPKEPSGDGLKECSKCGEEKPRSEFHRRSSVGDGLSSHCKDCRNKAYEETKKPAPVRSLGTQKCVACEEEKELASFPPNRNTRNGRAKVCSLCAEEQRAAEKADLERAMARTDEVLAAEGLIERRCVKGINCVRVEPGSSAPEPAILDEANPGPLCRGCQERAGITP